MELCERVWNEDYDIGHRNCLDKFVDEPTKFYDEVMKRAKERGSRGFGLALSAVLCKYCRKLMMFTQGFKTRAAELNLGYMRHLATGTTLMCLRKVGEVLRYLSYA